MSEFVAAPRIYLAGPEVFLPDAMAVFAAKKAVCAEFGLMGVSPIDNVVGTVVGGGEAVAGEIYRGNRAAMESAAAAIANITPFRGVSVDAGTAFEVGYICALGRPVCGYTSVPSAYAERVHAGAMANPIVTADAAPHMSVEDFGLAENLMIPFGITESGGALFVPEAPSPLGLRDLSQFRRCAQALANRLLVQAGG